MVLKIAKIPVSLFLSCLYTVFQRFMGDECCGEFSMLFASFSGFFGWFIVLCGCFTIGISSCFWFLELGLVF